MQGLALAGKAMHDRLLWPMGAQQGQHVGTCLALMQEQRHVVLLGQFQVPAQHPALNVRFAVVAMVVEPGLAHGAHQRLLQQGGQIWQLVFCQRARQVGMHACCGREQGWMARGQSQGCGTVLEAAAGDHHVHHAGALRPLQHRVEISGKIGVGEIGTDVDQTQFIWRDTRRIFAFFKVLVS
jgi:hypothetical protein